MTERHSPERLQALIDEGEQAKARRDALQGMYKASKAFPGRGSRAVTALIEAGIIPAECVRFELSISPKEAVRAKCEFNVTPEQMDIIAAAFIKDHEEGKRIVIDAILKRVPASSEVSAKAQLDVQGDGKLKEVDLRRFKHDKE